MGTKYLGYEPSSHSDRTSAHMKQAGSAAWANQLITGCLLAVITLHPLLAEPTRIESAQVESSRTKQPPLVMGIHPYRSAAILLENFKPLAAYLSQKTDRDITISITNDYDTHIQLIGEDKLDIAYMGPASYVAMVKRYGNKPLLARQAIHGIPTFQGRIVVRQDSTLSTLSDLAGKRFAFVDTESTMGHIVPRYMLSEVGIKLDHMAAHNFLGSHDNVALAVLVGDYDAGAVKEAVYKKYKDRGLKVLATTPTISEHLFVASNKLAPSLQQNLQTALLELKNDQTGPVIMSTIKHGTTAWMAVEDKDYDNLRHILGTITE